jgi:RNase P subunit RPR2
MTHDYTMEWIYHFTCSKCQNWWSYATTEVRLPVMHKRLTCPHCGFKDQVHPKPNQFRDKPA